MSEPSRIRCENLDFLRDLEAMAKVVTRGRNLVFEISPALLHGKCAKSEIVAQIARALPQLYVFDSGSFREAEWITVLQTISDAEIIAHESDIVAAAAEFRRVANELMQLQCAHLGVAFGAIGHDFEYSNQIGELDKSWRYFFHGWECAFKSKSGQSVDVRLEFAPEYGALDPYFFFQFMKSTSQFEELSRVFVQPYHDIRRTLEVLYSRGSIILVNNAIGSGYLAK